MKIGRFTIEQLSEGQFEFHKGGHYRRLESDSPDPSPPGGSIRRGTTILGIGPVLVQSEDYRLLLDTGLGWGMDAGSHYGDISNVKTNLEIFDLQPGDITDVILSHLHYDHAAGSTYVDAASRTSPTFPNATYHLHREEWEFALSHVESGDSPPIGSEYHLDEIYRLAADNRMNLIESDHLEILPGVDIVKTGGHTPGHLAVTI
ncbi:MAG: MBL fold metallo-hydrolase, partial [Balneolaceae bacterium]|nr:MBL fold metallo-hydrolase [Balneolaceae bacterium]